MRNREWKAWLLFHKREIFDENGRFWKSNVCDNLQKLFKILNINRGIDGKFT